MKVLVVCGSPRKNGNSQAMTQQLMEALRAKGADIETHYLHGMNFKGCPGCNACKTAAEACIVQDDLTSVLDSCQQIDVLILASPVYFGKISGHLKCFFDRTYSFLNPDFSSRLPSGKKAVIILSQGHPDAALSSDIYSRFKHWLKVYGFTETYLWRAAGVSQPGEVREKPEIMAHGEELAKKLIAFS